jgi:hypothetical protein
MFQLKPGTTASQFAAAQIEAGDAVMLRLHDKVDLSLIFSNLLFFLLQILGEMVNLQKSTDQKVLQKKVNLLKTPNMAFWLFYAQVDFLPS